MVRDDHGWFLVQRFERFPVRERKRSDRSSFCSTAGRRLTNGSTKTTKRTRNASKRSNFLRMDTYKKCKFAQQKTEMHTWLCVQVCWLPWNRITTRCMWLWMRLVLSWEHTANVLLGKSFALLMWTELKMTFWEIKAVFSFFVFYAWPCTRHCDTESSITLTAV